MKKIVAVICVIITFAIGIGTLATENKEAVFSEKENRMLEGMPELNLETIFNGEFAANFEKYMIDRIPFRNQLIGINSGISNSFSIVTLEDTLNVIDTKEVQQMEGLDNVSEDISVPAPTMPPAPSPTPVVAAPTVSDVSQTPTLEATYTPAPTATPNTNYFNGIREVNLKYIETNKDDKETILRRYRTNEVISFAQTLNSLNDLLGDDGYTVFVSSPQSKNVYPLIGTIKEDNPVDVVDEALQVLDYFTYDDVITLSAVSILEEHLNNQEYLYYLSDTHWTNPSCHYVYTEAMNQIGIEPIAWDVYENDYGVTYENPFLGTYYRDNPSSVYKNNPDTLSYIDFPQAELFNRYSGIKIIEEPILQLDAPSNDRYMVNFGGPRNVGSLSIVETTSDTGKNALALVDSFGLTFSQMLMPHYDKICLVDMRYMGWDDVDRYIADMVDEHGIDDIYMVVADFNTYGSNYHALIDWYMEK